MDVRMLLIHMTSQSIANISKSLQGQLIDYPFLTVSAEQEARLNQLYKDYLQLAHEITRDT
jgi:hypothetical protein